MMSLGSDRHPTALAFTVPHVPGQIPYLSLPELVSARTSLADSLPVSFGDVVYISVRIHVYHMAEV